MARSLALFFATLIAVSQAAPRPQEGTNPGSPSSANAPGSSPNTGASGGAPSTSSNSGSSGTGSGASGASPGTANSAGTMMTITIPTDILCILFPTGSGCSSGSSSNGGSAGGSSSSGLGASGSSSNGGSASGSSSNGGSASFNDPLTAIISIIPNAINQERNRIQTAVSGLVKDNVDAITDSINTAATTGGRVLSNGVKLVGAWPNFFGQLLG